MSLFSRRRAPWLLLLLVAACARAVLPPDLTASAPLEPRAGSAAEDTAGATTPDTGSAPGQLELPERVRVGLLTDQESIELPCCGSDILAIVGGRILVGVESIFVEPAVEKSGGGSLRLQIAALRDEEQALQLARTVEASMEIDTSVVFDAGTGLYRIRAGNYLEREEAERARRVFNQNNFHEVWVVGEQKELINPGLEVRRGDKAWVVPGRWMRVRSTSGKGLRMGDKVYRGDFLVYLNNRGTLNLINEVTLDDYLRGVVPREMGPKIFDNINALKAQAIAARTYTLRNMGEFTEEGYDICATPRCQVYGGLTAEDPLSDRAVFETSSEVLLHDGYYIDALYSSTCGGHTENVEVVFPLKSDSYLRGVPCLEAGVDKLGAESAGAGSLAAELVKHLAPGGLAAAPAADFAARVRALTELAGYSAPPGELDSLDRRAVQRFLASQFGLTLDAELFVAPEDVAYLLENPPPAWSEEDLHLAAYMARAGLLEGPLEAELSAATVERTLFRLALFLRVLEERNVRYLEQRAGVLVVRKGGEIEELEFDAPLRTYRRMGEHEEAAPVALLPGDRLTLYLRDGSVLAARHSVDPDGVAFDRTSNRSSWTHFRSDSELATRVAERYPTIDFERFEVLERGVSGRAREVEIFGKNGDSVVVRGLPIRWTLDVPDTLFTVRRLEPSDRESGWLFSGRGWGHGVGLCQVGSYGMAIRGHDYREILNHYYRSVEIARIETAPAPRRGLGQ